MKDELYLLDTSVWLEVLPPRGSAKLRERVDGLLANDAVATTGMVLLELLGGARSEREYTRLRELLAALHRLPVADGCWGEAAHLGSGLRRAGVAVPFSDLLIAVVAMTAGAVLVHRDRHFDLMAARVPLKVEGYVAAGGQ